MRSRHHLRPVTLLLLAISSSALVAQYAVPPKTLPRPAVLKLQASLDASQRHKTHVWRDTAPLNADGTVNAYVEIPRGERQKWEFDMAANARAVDRVIPEAIGGYPINYGFVPQTVSYDGDPFDVLVLGPAARGGEIVRGLIVGVMFMEDEKGLDSKVVVARTGGSGRPLHQLTPEIQRTVGDYFNRYKRLDPGAFSKVFGWGSIAEGAEYVATTHAFFNECRRRTAACDVAPSRGVTGVR